MGLKRSLVPTINKRIDLIRAVFAYGLEEQKVGNNPFVSMAMKEPKKEPKKVKGKHNPMSASNIRNLFAGLREGSEGYWAVMVALYQGARQNERLQLRKSDIVFERGSCCYNFLQT
jgi:integrase